MVVDWEQETGLLMTSGDVRVIRIWDTEREMKVQVMLRYNNFEKLFVISETMHGQCGQETVSWRHSLGNSGV